MLVRNFVTNYLATGRNYVRIVPDDVCGIVVIYHHVAATRQHGASNKISSSMKKNLERGSLIRSATLVRNERDELHGDITLVRNIVTNYMANHTQLRGEIITRHVEP